MRLPSGTRISLLLVFGFMLITTEFPEFSRFRPGRGKLMNMLIPSGDGEVLAEGEDGELTDLGEGEGQVERGMQTSILVEAWGFGGHRYRKWGCGGCGGYRRMYYYRPRYHHHGCHVCGKRKRK